jgi:hypothetical protein
MSRRHRDKVPRDLPGGETAQPFLPALVEPAARQVGPTLRAGLRKPGEALGGHWLPQFAFRAFRCHGEIWGKILGLAHVRASLLDVPCFLQNNAKRDTWKRNRDIEDGFSADSRMSEPVLLGADGFASGYLLVK